MRKIEEQMLQAIEHRKNWKSGNTSVSVSNEENGGATVRVQLHENTIFEMYENLSGCNETYFTLAGWNTTTTRSRLRALGINVHKRNGSAYCNGKEISDRHWYRTNEL